MPFGTVTLNDGNKIPAIAFGTGSKWKGTDVTQYVEQALKLGFVHLDTAQFYRTEPYVGRAIEESGAQRENLYITTKYGGIGTPRWAITQSLKNLGISSVDLYLIHTPRSVNIPFTWREFEKFKNEGLAKSIGVSNFDLEQLQKLVKESHIKPAVNQISLNPYNYAENKELIAYAAKHGIIIEAYSSLAPITRFPGGPVDEPVNAAAKRLGATPTQVILSWVASKGAVIVTTSSTEAHLREYLDVADLPALTEQEIAAIDAAGAQGPLESFDLEGGDSSQMTTRFSERYLSTWVYLILRALVGILALLVVVGTFSRYM